MAHHHQTGEVKIPKEKPGDRDVCRSCGHIRWLHTKATGRNIARCNAATETALNTITYPCTCAGFRETTP